MIRALIYGINNIFLIFYILIIGRIFLSWIPSIRWYEQPWKFIKDVTDVYLNIFRRFIPPIGMLDISPIIALLALQLIQNLIIFALLQFA